MENIFVLIFSLFREYVCFTDDGIAVQEGRKTELANAICFTKLLIFFTVSF